jgi:pyruvate, water dikinase
MSHMSHVVWFKDLGKNSIAVAGGKGANLGEMWNAQFPIPPGFVVTAQTYEYFVTETQIQHKILSLLDGLDIEETEKLQAVAKEIQELIISTPIPEDIKVDVVESYSLVGVGDKSHAEDIVQGTEEFVAVRSSATAEDLPEASFAGQQATFLNVRGEIDVVDAVRKCWASLFTARAIYYRQKNNFPHDKVFIAVIVQKMVNSEKAGVMFTVNPATNDESEIVIEGAFGLGEAVVSGSVTPDFYVVDKETLDVKDAQVKEQGFKIVRDSETGGNVQRELSPSEEKLRVLSDRDVQEIARYGRKLENNYNHAQDVEWAIEKDKVYIVQTRAVTTLAKKAVDEMEVVDAPILVRGETASRGHASGPVCIIKDARELSKVRKGDILVTGMTNPDMVPAMQKAAAIVTDDGGMTSHAAIVSREIGIPCIVGTGKGTSVLIDGQTVTVDATHAIVYEGDIAVKEEVKKKEHHDEPTTKTKVKVIMDFPDRAADVAKQTGADGVGLLRLEFLIAGGGVHPAEYIRNNEDGKYTELLVREISKVAEAFKGKPVWARGSDVRTDEYRNLKGGDKEPHETDPMIGWHGIRRLLDVPRMLKAEFAAIKKLHELGHTNVGVMVPFVIRVDEVREAKKYLREVGLEPCTDVEFGVMIETPAACWVIEEICKEGVDFVSFGTNDLTQLTLGIDRNNGKIQDRFDEMHPAVLGEIAMVIETCKKFDVKTSICGQAASRPEMAQFLVEKGIDSVSPNPDAVDTIRHVVAKMEKGE